MDNDYVHEPNTVINELTQGIQMAKQLRFNLSSPEARQFYMQKILSSYENALFVLKSGDSTTQPQAAALPSPSLPGSSIPIGSPQSKFDFDQFDQPSIYQQGQNVFSRKRKGSTMSEAAYKRKYTCNNGSPLAVSPPHSAETHKIIPMHQRDHYRHQLSPPKHRELTPHLITNLSFNRWVFEDYQQFQFPSNIDDYLFQVNSPPLLSPTTSESNYFTEWGSSPSLDFCADPANVDPWFQV